MDAWKPKLTVTEKMLYALCKIIGCLSVIALMEIILFMSVLLA